jgi:murein DD-endopeptidase MepM/ murein hydrolase activator NlpD
LQKTLKVTYADESTKTIEFNVETNSVSIPFFLALYQTKQTNDTVSSSKNDDIEADLAIIDEELGDAHGEELDKKIKDLSNKSWDDNTKSKTAKTFSKLNGDALADVLRKNFKDGFYAANSEAADGKLVITLSAPSEIQLYKAFGLTLDSKMKVMEYQSVIENKLNEAKVLDGRNISADNLLDLNLFSRFEGLFAFPADKTEVDGLGLVYAQTDKQLVHQDGLTVNFKQPEKPKDGEEPIEKQPVEIGTSVYRKCVVSQSVSEISANSVTLKYSVNTDTFLQEYGFPFSEVVGKSVSGVVDLEVKYDGLDSVTAAKNSADNLNETFSIGTASENFSVFVKYQDKYIEPRLVFSSYETLQFEPLVHEPNSKSILQYPLDPKWHLLTTLFGYDAWRSGMHYGVDIGDTGIEGADVLAAADGVVAAVVYTIERNSVATDEGGWGNYVLIDHGNGLQTRYAHLQPMYKYETSTGDVYEVKKVLTSAVIVGQQVKLGQKIGEVGSTGYASGYHLHFEVLADGTRVNPLNYYDNFP